MTEERGPIDPDAFYTLKEARTHLRISDATARRWVKSGRLPAEKFGRDYRVRGRYVVGGEQEAPNFKVLSPDSPFFDLEGIGVDDADDVAERHDDYATDAYLEHLNRRT